MVIRPWLRSLRPAIYLLLKGLAYKFADPKLKANLPLAFTVLDPLVAKALEDKTPDTVDHALRMAAKIASGDATNLEAKAQQLADIFDAKAFVASMSAPNPFTSSP